MAIVLILPMCLLASVTGLLARGMSIDILAQIGFVVLVGLAAKNAILIVEFARQKEEEGAASGEAAVYAARTRLRPILMTPLAFVLDVAPLAVATGAGAEMRQSLGTAVLFGMLGVTLFGLVFTPAFYTSIRKLGLQATRRGRLRRRRPTLRFKTIDNQRPPLEDRGVRSVLHPAAGCVCRNLGRIDPWVESRNVTRP